MDPDSASAYPIRYFLHSSLAVPLTLHNLLSSPVPLKLRKAWLPGYVTAPHSTVFLDCRNFGEWEAEPEVLGFMFEACCIGVEEKMCAWVMGNGGREMCGVTGLVKVVNVEFEARFGSVIWGWKEWVNGRTFVRVVKEEDGGEGDGRRIGEAVEKKIEAVGDSVQDQESKASLGQEWDSGQVKRPVVFTVGNDGYSSGTNTAAPTPAIYPESSHSLFFNSGGPESSVNTANLMPNHPATPSSSTLLLESSNNVADNNPINEAASNQNLEVEAAMTKSWSSRSLPEKMGIKTSGKKKSGVDGAREGHAQDEQMDDGGKIKGVRSLVAMYEKLKM